MDGRHIIRDAADRRTHVERINQPLTQPKDTPMTEEQFNRLMAVLEPIAACAQLALADHERREEQRKRYEEEERKAEEAEKAAAAEEERKRQAAAAAEAAKSAGGQQKTEGQ